MTTTNILRPYQIQLLDKILSASGEGVLAVLPTGAGKTNIIVELVRHYLSAHKSVCILVHSKELIEQIYDRLAQYGLLANVICASVTRDSSDLRVWVASVQTLVNRPDTWDIVIIDEAHHACANTYKKILEFAQPEKVVGLTATPCRLDGKPLGRKYDGSGIFDVMVECIGIYDLVAQGYLAPLEFQTFGNGQDAKIVKKGYEYDAALAEKKYNTGAMHGDMIRAYRNLETEIGNVKAIVYACSITHAIAIYEHYSAEGINTGMLHSKMGKQERGDTIANFKENKINVIVNVEILTEGFDCPGTNCVQIVRPTASKSLYMQMVGRAMRPITGKLKGYVIDHTDNTQTFNDGLVLLEPYWFLDIPSFTIVPTDTGRQLWHSERWEIRKNKAKKQLYSRTHEVPEFLGTGTFRLDFLVRYDGQAQTELLNLGWYDVYFEREPKQQSAPACSTLMGFPGPEQQSAPAYSTLMGLPGRRTCAEDYRYLKLTTSYPKKIDDDGLVVDYSGKNTFIEHQISVEIVPDELAHALGDNLSFSPISSLNNRAVGHLKKAKILALVYSFSDGRIDVRQTPIGREKQEEEPKDRESLHEDRAEDVAQRQEFGLSLDGDLRILYNTYERKGHKPTFVLNCYMALRQHNADAHYINKILERMERVCNYKSGWAARRQNKPIDVLISETLDYYKVREIA